MRIAEVCKSSHMRHGLLSVPHTIRPECVRRVVPRSSYLHSEILYVDKQNIKKEINRTITEQKQDAGDREI